jgi:25S rRNA (uracil2634-N3)-methyltransferase
MIGNFSFSLSFAEKNQRADNFVCTSFDSKNVALEKYPELDDNTGILVDLEALVHFDVDATKLTKTPCLKNHFFNKIIFNFPHVGLGIKDQKTNIIANQSLINTFFQEAKKKLLPEGQIIVSLKTGLPYDLWEIKKLAKENQLKVERSFEFVPADYPGYAHRRTIGFDHSISAKDNEEILKNQPRTYIFTC